MAFQSVPNTVEIDHIFTLNGVTVQNVHYAEHTTGYNQADLQAMADKIDLAFPSTWVGDMPTEVSYVKTDVRGLNAENDLVATQNLSAGPGTHVGTALPNNVTFAVKKSSGLTGRSARGRTFWIGVPRTILESTDENIIQLTYADQVVVDVEFIRLSIASVPGFSPVLVSRFLNKVKRATGVTFPWLTTSFVDRRVDTHRGRLPPG